MDQSVDHAAALLLQRPADGAQSSALRAQFDKREGSVRKKYAGSAARCTLCNCGCGIDASSTTAVTRVDIRRVALAPAGGNKIR